jgi:hypothetical protein
MSDFPTNGANPERCYANCFRVGFSAYEFIFEFGQVYPPESERLQARIVTSAPMARSLWATLQQSLQDFDRKFQPPGEEK